jgi:hypothetical protein
VLTRFKRKQSESVEYLYIQVKGAVEDHAKKSYSVFEPHSYKTQVVAGTNYFVKVIFPSASQFLR